MREILFRGKNAKGKWIEGDLYRSRLKSIFMISYYTEYGNRMTEAVNPETVGQYTGLTDSNGKKIFEGDIVKRIGIRKDLKGEPKETKIGEVVFEQGEVRARCGDWFSISYLWKGDSLEVIGNIHDNPELLEGVCSYDK